MHMSDGLVSTAVGATLWAVSSGALAYSMSRIHKDPDSEKRLPLMAVTGAFVFAAQMVNFSIPGTGSSGHIGGGILLAAVLGGSPAFLAIAIVLAIQALFFADGGLIALGANMFNLGVIPCLIVYPLVFKPFIGRELNQKRLQVVTVVSVVVALILGSVAVVVQTLASGITALPFQVFLSLMVPIHLAIGLVEGLVTAGVLTFLVGIRPELIGISTAGDSRMMHNGKPAFKKVFVVLAVMTLLIGGLASNYASSSPDGLEWSIEKVTGSGQLATHGKLMSFAQWFQDKTAFMPDYDYLKPVEKGISGTSLAGIVGALLTFTSASVLGLLIRLFKRSKTKIAD